MKFKNFFYAVFKLLILSSEMLSMDNRTVMLSIHGNEGKIQIKMLYSHLRDGVEFTAGNSLLSTVV